MPRTTFRILACFGSFLMIFLLASEIGARGRGGGGGGGRGGFSRGGGGFSRGGGGFNRGGGSSPGRQSPNISRRGPATGGTFSRDGGYSRSSTRPTTLPERSEHRERSERRETDVRRDSPADRSGRADRADDRPNREERRDEAKSASTSVRTIGTNTTMIETNFMMTGDATESAHRLRSSPLIRCPARRPPQS